MKHHLNRDNVLMGIVAALMVIMLVIARIDNWTANAVSVASFIILTGAILFDSRLTRASSKEEVDRTLSDSKSAREATDRPLVLIYFERHYPEKVFLTVQNAGTAPAAQVRFQLDQVISSSISDQFHQLPMLKHGMHFMPPGFSTTVAFDWISKYTSEEHKSQYREAHDTDLPMIYTGSVHYSHALSPERVFAEPIVLDIQYLEGQGRFIEKRVHDIANELQKIRQRVDSMESSLRNLSESAYEIQSVLRKPDTLSSEELSEDEMSEEELKQLLGNPEWWPGDTSDIPNPGSTDDPEISPDPQP